jgi:2-oxoglutarate ferredoxin oxidoreductase subunit beta
MVTIQDYQSPNLPTWCPGCGDFVIWNALKQALVQEGIGPMDVILCFDIGCNGNMADKINAYAFKGLHGRSIPVAAGVSLANQEIPVIALAGDGATFDEGMQHFVHAIRSNYNVTFILHNNCDFGLTTGQATPTTPKGQKLNGTPYGVIETRLNPTQLALTLGATFVAKAFTGNMPQLIKLIRAGINHKGFSYIETLQHCPTYNNFQDLKWLSERVYDVNADTNYKNTRENAIQISSYDNERVATGLLYQDKESVSYYDALSYRQNIVTKGKDEVKAYSVKDLMKKFQ